MFYDISSTLLPQENRNSSIAQLAAVSHCLEQKLACLGFGNHLAHELTRLRLCCPDGGARAPKSLDHIPTIEVMQEYLVDIQKALSHEDELFRYRGNRSAGIFVAIATFICPDDVLIEVDGEILFKGERQSVVFSIVSDAGQGTSFHVESKIKPHTNSIQVHHMQTGTSLSECKSLKFSWEGHLSSRLRIIMPATDIRALENLEVSIASFMASSAESFTASDWSSGSPYRDVLIAVDGRDNPIAGDGIKTLLGPDYRTRISTTLSTILAEPSIFTDPVICYDNLLAAMEDSYTVTNCTCGFCKQHNLLRHSPWGYCPVVSFTSTICAIVDIGMSSLFVKPLSKSTLSMDSCKKGPFSNAMMEMIRWEKELRGRDRTTFVSASEIHSSVISILGRWPIRHDLNDKEEPPPIVCRSQGYSTIYPSTLEHPTIPNPWAVDYTLVDGRLSFGADTYAAILGASSETGSTYKLKRPQAVKSLVSKDRKIGLSSLGEHSKLEMTLRPEFYDGIQVLILRTTVQSSTKILDFNFVDCQIGFLSLTPAPECDHRRDTSSLQGGIAMATSVLAPIPSTSGLIGVTLTHWNGEAQFLSCITGVQAVYQGDCCVECAIKQAQRQRSRLVIGGSESSTYFIQGN
jgi:hypothetical protein